MFVISLLLTWFDYTDYMYVWDQFYIDIWFPTIYCIIYIIYPSLYNTQRARNMRQWYRCHVLSQSVRPNSLIDDMNELYGILHSKLGFNYMLIQCSSEFNEETLYCLQSIWSYTQHPSFTTMHELYNDYINDSSPLQVNISATTRETLHKLILSFTDECNVIEIADIYHGVESELMKLLINNSYTRFKQSQLYKLYMHNTPLKSHDKQCRDDIRRSRIVSSRCTNNAVWPCNMNDSDNKSFSVQLHSTPIIDTDCQYIS